MPEVGYLISVELNKVNVANKLKAEVYNGGSQEMREEDEQILKNTIGVSKGFDTKNSFSLAGSGFTNNNIYLLQPESAITSKKSSEQNITMNFGGMIDSNGQNLLQTILEEEEHLEASQLLQPQKQQQQQENQEDVRKNSRLFKRENHEQEEKDFIKEFYTESQLNYILKELGAPAETWNLLFERFGTLFFKSDNTELLDDKLGNLNRQIIDIQLVILSELEELVKIHKEFFLYIERLLSI